MLLFGAFSISFAGVFMRWSVLEPVATAFWRICLALPILALLVLRSGRAHPRPSPPLKVYLWLLLPGFFFAGDLALWHWSMAKTTIANSTLLANCAPIFVTIFAVFVLKERITWRFLLGLFLAFVGVLLLVRGNLYWSRDTLIGDALGVMTAFFYGSYQLAVRHVRGHFSTLSLMLGSGITTGVLLFLIAWLTGESFFAPDVPWWRVWLPLLGLALLVHTVGQGSIAYALAHLPSAFSSVTLMFQPVVTAVWGWLILNEAIGPWQGVGGAVILVAIALARQGSVREPVPPGTPEDEEAA
jgi:drug/metabolite transporter (DMT)-like permease